MAGTYNKEVYDIYSIFKSKRTTTATTAAQEMEYLADIEKALRLGAGVIKNTELREVFELYMKNKAELSASSGSTASSGVQSTADIIGAYFRTQSEVNSSENVKIQSKLWSEIIPDTIKNITAGNKKGRDDSVQTLVSLGFLDQEGADYLKKTMADWPDTGLIIIPALLFSLISAFMRTAGGVMSGDFVKKMNAKFTPNYLDVGTLIKALHTAPELTQSINKKLAENGLNDEDIKILKVSNYAVYEVGQIRECFLRGIITESKMVERMGELGFTPERIKEISATWNVIPGPQDLFWLVGKEAFEPDQISKFGLGAEFPTEQLKWLKMQGVSEDWAMKYWVAHWDYPSEGRVLELFHRGLIDDKTLDDFYRLIEITPYWRDKLKQASYSLYTRVDLRRMHDMGLITDEDVYKNFRAEGYDDIHAKNMTKFYIQYNEDNNKELNRTQIENAYKADLITKKQAIEMLMKMKYTNEQANFMIELMDYNELVDMQKLRIKTIQKSYKNYDVSQNEARSLLSRLNVETKWVDFYIQTWDAERVVEEKLPTKAEITGWLSAQIIDKPTYIAYMRKLRYSDTSISNYLKELGL